ncbi:ATP-dependent helicase [Candidatus Saccharibacteria bacterium]|nr:MAG: ATP-dependent helicase [Candidatus Saccharibacteria bacterium]
MRNNSYNSRRPGAQRPSFGGQRSSFGGPRRSFNNKPKTGGRTGAYIHPSKFVNKAVTPKTEVVYIANHQFADFPFSKALHANIAERNFVQPSAIQDQAIPYILEGKDVIGLANTGTGKTAAFVLPMIEHLSRQKTDMPAVLIMAPTRELAAQIDDEFRRFSRGMRLFSALCVGGMNIGYQIRDLNRRPHVVIGTPGRLKDLSNKGVLKLDQVEILVLDEADRMLDMGFLPDIRHIVGLLPKERQSLCFSATITPAIQDLINTLLIDPVTVSVRTSETSEHVEQDVIEASSKEEKIDILNKLLAEEEFDKVLIFGQTKFGVQRLADKLTQDGFPSAAIHGDKSQPQRQRALNQFKRNDVKVLVATDVAARGLDIPNVSHVINFDQPMTYEDYVHRIGRTGRGGAKGKAFTFVEPRRR